MVTYLSEVMLLLISRAAASALPPSAPTSLPSRLPREIPKHKHVSKEAERCYRLLTAAILGKCVERTPRQTQLPIRPRQAP